MKNIFAAIGAIWVIGTALRLHRAFVLGMYKAGIQ